MMRWIDELNGVIDADEKAKDIRKNIKWIKRQPSSPANAAKVKKLYQSLDEIQFKPDYVCIIMDSKSDYHRACKGFRINGIKYRRLLGTNGGIKNSTIVFVSEFLYPELNKRVNNGRKADKELVTAKLEAYKALTCSASFPVSMPNGVLVIPDIETEFREDIIYMNDENSDEPEVEYRKDELVRINPTDGCGMMSPALARRWSDEMNLGYAASGMNIRFCWSKGMVFPFDFYDFADNVAHKRIVKDAWGNDVDIHNVELILTTSQVKLWDSYDSCDDFLKCCKENNYTFGIAKTAPEHLESERGLNYQFIQSYDLSNDDIDELIEPTMRTIDEIMDGDYRKSILFSKGVGLNDSSVIHSPDDCFKALMVDERVVDDPYVRNKLFNMLKGRIKDAKVGVIQVHANYSIISGDLYALCQGMFDIPVTGLLKSGEIYNEYWRDSEKLVCFRAPMTCHNNIRMVYPQNRDDVNYWFRYIKTCTILNGWDLIANSLNGADFDGDLCMLTDNDVLIRRFVPLPSIMCIQRKAKKSIATEEDFIKSNIDSFGNDIGQTTNWITSMFEVRGGFDKGSAEYETLSYRIMCGQLFQQNAIDKSKGVIVKPMPKHWHDWREARSKDRCVPEDKGTCGFNERIVADKKPYFMIYIYPQLMRKYKKYVKDSNKHSLREFGLTIEELVGIDPDERTDRQNIFLQYYDRYMPVGINDCVMNIICKKFEDRYDHYLRDNKSDVPFDYTILKSNVGYSQNTYGKVKALYEEYQNRVKGFECYRRIERIDEDESMSKHMMMKAEFLAECSRVCPNKYELCDIVLDICYSTKNSKSFAWDMSGSEIIHNLLDKNKNLIRYPASDRQGDIVFSGMRFSMKEVEVCGEEFDE